MPAGWIPASGDYPLPPQNGVVTTPFQKGIHDLRWDNPALLSHNSAYTVVGVNVYRSEASSRGPFHRLNEFPVGVMFFRDSTLYTRVSEAVDWNTGWVFKGDKPNQRQYQLRTTRRIVKATTRPPYAQPVFANAPTDVEVTIDGVAVPVESVFGRTGEVTLINQDQFNLGTEENLPAILPTENSEVVISYYTPTNHVPSGLEHNIWYRVTTVVLDSTTASGYAETPLDRTEPFSLMEVERRDWIWDEAVRRNQWIVQQGGERVKVFVRKVVGLPCDCTRDARSLEWSKQPESRCLQCFSTGIVGGYDGPYEVFMAPDDAERRLSWTNRGRNKDHVEDVWMGPTPVVSQRDFVVKQTNERYIIGAPRRPTNRGNLLQQHFQMSYLDEGDIRYAVSIDGTEGLASPETRSGYTLHMPRMPVTGERSYDEQEGWAGAAYPEGTDPVSTPMVTDKDNTPDNLERRGRTRVWENQSYVIWFVVPLLLQLLAGCSNLFGAM